MTTINIQIQKNHIKAVAHAMATKDIRTYLCGVHVEFDNVDLRMVATDGHRIHLVHQGLGGPAIERVCFTIPLDMVKHMIKSKTSTLSIYFDTDSKMITWDNLGQKTSMQAVEGAFPNWRRVVGTAGTHEPEIGLYNPAYVLDTDKAVRDYLSISAKSFPPVMFTPQGECLGFVTVDGLFCGVMAVRSGGIVKHGNVVNAGLFA